MTRKLWSVVAVLALALAVPVAGPARTTPRDDVESLEAGEAPAEATVATLDGIAGPSALLATLAACTPGARTLAQPGSRVYPERATAATRASTPTSTSVYDAPANLFLPGTHVDLSSARRSA